MSQDQIQAFIAKKYPDAITKPVMSTQELKELIGKQEGIFPKIT